MGVDMSHYRATIGSFIGKSSKEKKGVKNWFADRHEASPDKLLCVSVFIFLSLSVIVRMLPVMQGVEENPGPRHIIRMSSLDEPKVFSVDMMECNLL